ncbi:MAG: tRNA (adenosine(37)-N6)-threonylcarbamoyltransferase complex dimerization subunit type 1 TsaB [Candidatus Binatia bacterium]
MLGIETTTAVASVGLVSADATSSEQAAPPKGNHARILLPLIDAVLASGGANLAGVDLLAVSIGPGSFTGLRIGLSVAKGLALAADRPILGVPTLEAYARTAGPRAGAVCPVLDARKGQVYGAIFHWRGDELVCEEPGVAVTPEEFAARLEGPCTLLGDGVDAYAAVWSARLGSRVTMVYFADLPPSGAVVARMGMALAMRRGVDDLALLEPFYCRLSEAEVQRGRHAAAGVWKN